MFRRWTHFFAALVVLTRAAVWSVSAEDEPAFIRAGDVWRFFKASSEPPGAASDWTRPGYVPGPEWLSGRSGIGTYVGGRDAENVLLYDRNYNYVAVCFRREFVLTDPGTFHWMVLRIDYQEGFVAYLNGTEVLRVGLAGNPGDPVPVTTLATTRVSSRPAEFRLADTATTLLHRGTNVLAIQMHTDRIGPGFPFSPTTGDLLCTAELLGNFQRGPFVQRVSEHAAYITWKTPVAASGMVEFGADRGLGKSAATTLPATQQEVRLGDLEPDTQYYYRVRASDGAHEVVSPMESFRTFKLAGDITFCVLGDSGGGTESQYRTAELIRSHNPDLVLHVGDIIYSSFDPFRVDTRCVSIYGPHMRSTPYFFTLGNHDMYYDQGASYIDAFCLPTNSVPAEVHRLEKTTPEHYYSFDHGDVHFVCLFNPQLNYYNFAPGTAQYAWLEQDLAASRKKWKILFQHIPVHTSGPHVYDEFNYNGTNDVEDVRAALLPLANRYGVNLILSGHDHLFERFAPDQGVHCVVTGAGGVLPLYSLSLLDPLSAKAYSTHHHSYARIQGDTLTLQAIGTNGAPFDQLVIQRAPPPVRSYQADWASIKFPSIGADDQDGNLYGQSWPFTEAPDATIQSSSGAFANLGRLRVSSDTTNLFLGLEHAMLPPGADAVVFLEVPGITGVTNLAAVGNGRLDPETQGVDGLDFLKNLAFTNFTPSFALLLGDEFADATRRDFQRNGSAHPGGQGVFRLNAGLDSIGSARIQQFNQATQYGPMFGEANADYMVVSIPCAVLGNLAPLETIRVAVIAARGIADTPTSPVREVDTGFIGATLEGGGANQVVLQGLAVQMPEDGDPDHDGVPSAVEKALGTDPARADTDGDGLDDLWELTHSLNPNQAGGADGADGDPDGDGLSNLDERRLGADPRNAASALAPRIQVVDPGRVRVFWPALANTICLFESAPGPGGPFAIEAEVAPAGAGIAEFLITVQPGERFFRLRFRPAKP